MVCVNTHSNTRSSTTLTYDTVLKRTRRDYHAKVAAWMSGLSGARASDYLGAAGEHFEKAGDNNACEFFTRAAERAAARYAHEAATGYVAGALALIGEVPIPMTLLLRWRLVDVRERMLDLQGRRTEQRTDIDALERLANVLEDDDGR